MVVGGGSYIGLTKQLSEYTGWEKLGLFVLAAIIFFVLGAIGIMIQEIFSITYSKWKNGGTMNGLKL